MSRPKREATVAEKRRHSTKITGRPPTQSAARPRGRATAKTGDGRSPSGKSPSQLITDRIAELGDWRGEVLSRVRKLIREADPEIVEEWKWRGVPVWSHNGIVCTGESYTQIIKLTFAKGLPSRTPNPSSTPASTATSAGRLTSARAKRSTNRHLKASSVTQSR